MASNVSERSALSKGKQNLVLQVLRRQLRCIPWSMQALVLGETGIMKVPVSLAFFVDYEVGTVLHCSIPKEEPQQATLMLVK